MAKREKAGLDEGFDVHETVSGGADAGKPNVEDLPKRAIRSNPPLPQPKGKPEDRLRRALKNMLDNTPADATPRPVRQEAEAAVKGG